MVICTLATVGKKKKEEKELNRLSFSLNQECSQLMAERHERKAKMKLGIKEENWRLAKVHLGSEPQDGK